MPFTDKTVPVASASKFRGRVPFVGRTNELEYFKRNVLEADNPKNNIITISG